MDSRIPTMPTPIYSMQHSKFTRQDGWQLDDISLCSCGHIAVSGGHYYDERSFLYTCSTVDNSDSRDKPTFLYEKEFEKYTDYWPWRYISFIKPNCTEIVTCLDDNVTVLDYNRDVVLRSRKVNGFTTCLSVSESQIFIGLMSDIVSIYDIDLNEMKSIKLKGISGDWPSDISAVVDRLYLCTYKCRAAIVYSQTSGNILTRYTTVQGYSKASSITVSVQLGVAAVVWNRNRIIFYLLSENKSFLTVNIDDGVSRIRISDQGRIVTGNEHTGEVKIYNLASIFTFGYLKKALVSWLKRSDCEKLIDFFAMGGEASNTISKSDRSSATILLALEEKSVIKPSNVDRLEEAFLGLKMIPSFYQVVNLYQKLRDQTTLYDRFLATLSAHLTSSLPRNLCDYFNIPDENKDSIISSPNPGLSLLLALDEMCVIKPSEVGPLEQPFNKFRLVQAVAKIHEYQVMFEYEKGQISQTVPQNLDGKRAMFVEFLKKKIKNWYETMTPVPWKKSCKWKSTDLFVGSGLILTDSKSKKGVQNIDEQCKLNYTEIFSHPKLKSEIRITLEGDPGAGKTMLLSQLAYDWSKSEISDVDILIFLPLKIVGDKTLIQAIKDFYIPANMPISVKDIENILASEAEKICLLLDGLEEYSNGGRMRTKESSEVMKVMKKEKHSNCKVVITSRSDFAHDLPESPLLKIGRFGETERHSYIEKLSPENTDKQQKIKRVIQDNPFLLDLCSVPLLFVLTVHNIENMNLSKESRFNKVAPFMRSMILTLCLSTSVEQEIDGIRPKFFSSEKMTLGELAFNGLCKGHQQLSWQKEFMESNVGNMKPWVDSGILVLEEGIEISEKEDEKFYGSNKEEERDEKTKNKDRKKERNETQKQKGEDGGQIGSADKDASLKSKKEKKKKTDKNPVVTDGMLTAEFVGPSTSHDMPQLPVILDEMLTTGLSAPSANHEVPEMKESHQSVSKNENDTHVRKKKTIRRIPNQVPLAVKFPHKVIQEWFAATFLCSMMRRCTSAEQLRNYVINQLHHIDPTDLHYILRFTCYLHPPSCHIIMNYLLRSYRKDGHVPLYIMSCVFLCFNEHNDVKGSDMKNIVKDVCKEVITIQSEDSRLLQQAKSSLLEYASNGGVIIEKLELKDVIFTVNKTSLTLNSGVQLGVLHMLKMIEVSRWDQVLQEEDYINILRLLSQGMLMKKICCIFPSQPPEFLDEITLGNVISKDLQVEWNIGHLVQTLDPKNGKWMMTFKQPGASATKSTQVTREQDSLGQREETQQPAICSLPGTSSDSTKHFQNQETPKRTGSDSSITEAAVSEKKAKIVVEGAVVSNVMQRAHHSGTAGNGSEENDVWEETTVSGDEAKAVQDESPTSGFEQRFLCEETPLTCVGQWGNQEETAASSVEERIIQDQAATHSVTQRVLQDEATVSSVGQRFFLEEAAFSGATQRFFHEVPFVTGAARRVVLQGGAPVNGVVQSQLTVGHNQFLLQAQAVITQYGGVIEIPNTGVVLRIPQNALPEDMRDCLIQMRIIPVSLSNDETMSFSSNSSVRVELRPNHFKFRCHLELTLPHCLELKHGVFHRARIFMSHHNEGESPQWEEQIEQFYQLLETTCVVWIKSFCWIKYEIDGEIVEAKKLKIYTAARKMYLDDMHAIVEVGYHLDMPGEQEILKMNPDLILANRKPFVFFREGNHSLFVHFMRIVPHQWKYIDQNPKEIPFRSVAASLEETCQFMVAKETQDRDIPMCMFIASQRHRTIERTVDLMIRPEVHPFATPWDVR